MNGKLRIKIIAGSTREGRLGDKIAHWVFDNIKDNELLTVDLVDLKEIDLPIYNQPISPAYSTGYSDPKVINFSKIIDEADGYIIVVPEYNHSFPGVLKNAIDSIYKEWSRKPVAFVSYSGGLSGGIRAVEQLRLVIAELQMVSVRHGVHIPFVANVVKEDGSLVDKEGVYIKALNVLTENLIWWTSTLKNGRNT